VGSPQPGIFALGTNSHAYLELDLAPGAAPLDAVTLVASLREPRTTIGGVNLVAGFRPELWAAIAPDAAPAGVAGFNEPVRGPDGYELPAGADGLVSGAVDAGADVGLGVAVGEHAAMAPMRATARTIRLIMRDLACMAERTPAVGRWPGGHAKTVPAGRRRRRPAPAADSLQW